MQKKAVINNDDVNDALVITANETSNVVSVLGITNTT